MPDLEKNQPLNEKQEIQDLLKPSEGTLAMLRSEDDVEHYRKIREMARKARPRLDKYMKEHGTWD